MLYRAYMGLYGDNGKELEATIQGLGFGNTLGGPPTPLSSRNFKGEW